MTVLFSFYGINNPLSPPQLSEVSLQLIFTDGEEAFRAWTATDSLYGSRRLARDMEPSAGLLSVNGKSALEVMEAFVLLDLIGSTSPWPTFYDMYHETTNLFQRIVKIGEPRMAAVGGHYLQWYHCVPGRGCMAVLGF